MTVVLAHFVVKQPAFLGRDDHNRDILRML